MRKYLVLFYLLFITIKIGAQGSSYYAADSLIIDEIVVTHSRIPLQSRPTPKPVQIISAKMIEMSAGKDLAQVLNEQVGINVIGALSNPGKDKSVFVRGASGEYTLILVDGLPIIDPSGLGGVTDIRSFSLASIDRIEILKGSQSALYGSDAIAGVINIITKKESTKGKRYNANLSYGSYQTLIASVGVRGSSEKVSYNISAAREQSGGISEALSPDPNVTFKDDAFDLTSVRSQLDIKLSNSWSLKPFMIYSDYNSDTDDGSFADADNSYTNKLINGGAALSFNQEAWKGQITYAHSSTDRSFDSSFGLSEFFGRFNNVDIWANYAFSEEVQLTGGMNMQAHKMLDETTTMPNPKENIYSPYVSLLFGPSDRLNGELGYRYNNHSKFGSNSNFSAAVSYWISDDLKVFSNYSTGFKAPNLFQLYGAFGANEDLLPQVSSSFEMGINAPSISGVIQPQVTYFKRKVDDVIAFSFGPGYFNRDTQDDQGIEVELGVKLGEGIILKGTYTFLDGEQIQNENGTETIVDNLYRRPKHQYGLTAYYSKEAFNINMSVRRVGERNDLFFNPANFFAAEDVILDSYTYASLYAQYSINQNFTTFLDLKNLGNADFQEIYGFSTARTNFSIGIRMSW